MTKVTGVLDFSNKDKGDGLMAIKELRTVCGMTQQAFSDYFGIPKRTIEDWEAGRRKPARRIRRSL